MKFLITYSALVLPAGEASLSPALVEHHASCLEGDLRREHALDHLRMNVRATFNGLASEVQVEFVGVSDAQAVTSALAEAVARINSRTPGLCFVF